MRSASAPRYIAALVSLVLGLVALSSAPAWSGTGGPGPANALQSAPVTTVARTNAPSTTTLDNPFIPEEANVSDCISALPRPECGSKARGGWHQALVFVALIAGLTVIAWRLVVSVRRRARSASV